jgi:cytochrome c oxidase subunit 2
VGDILAVAVSWAVLTAAGEWAAVRWINSGPWDSGPYFYVASNLGTIGLHAFNFLLECAIPIFMFVVVLLAYSMIRFRVRRGEVAGPAQDQRRFNGAFVGTWVILSILLNLMFFIHPTASGLEAIYAAQLPQNNRKDLVVDVAARQWEWVFSYPQYHISQAVNSEGLDVLYLPVNRPVEFVLQSYDPFHSYDRLVDVIHSFWVPAFGVKEDVMPGETRYLYLTPTHITSTEVNPLVRVQCAEVCGGGHPYMEANVHVVSYPDFLKWVKLQQNLQSGA